MLESLYLSRFVVKVKPWCFFTILAIVTLVCISCSDAIHQTGPSQRPTAQSSHLSNREELPLTDSVPIASTISASTPLNIPLTVTPTMQPSPWTATIIATSGISYEAEASQNTLTGNTLVYSCANCSGGKRVRNIGIDHNTNTDGTLQFNNVGEKSTGNYLLTIYYLDGDYNRSFYVSVNGGPDAVYTVSTLANWTIVGKFTITVSLNAGSNTIKFHNPQDYAPDMDRIVV